MLTNKIKWLKPCFLLIFLLGLLPPAKLLAQKAICDECTAILILNDSSLLKTVSSYDTVILYQSEVNERVIQLIYFEKNAFIMKGYALGKDQSNHSNAISYHVVEEKSFEREKKNNDSLVKILSEIKKYRFRNSELEGVDTPIYPLLGHQCLIGKTGSSVYHFYFCENEIGKTSKAVHLNRRKTLSFYKDFLKT